MKKILSWVAMRALLFAVTAWAGATAADAWPVKPIRPIAPVPPGGGVDILDDEVARWGPIIKAANIKAE